MKKGQAMIIGTGAPRWKLTRMPRCGIEHADVLFAAFDRLCAALEYELPALPFDLRLKVSRIVYACTAQAARMGIGTFSVEESPERAAAEMIGQDGGFSPEEVRIFAQSGILGDGKWVFSRLLAIYDGDLREVCEDARRDAAYEVCRRAAEGCAPSSVRIPKDDFVAGWAVRIEEVLKLLPGGLKDRQAAFAAEDFRRLSDAVYIGAAGVLARRDILECYARRRRIPLEVACDEMNAWERDGLFGRAQYREIAAAHFNVASEQVSLLEEALFLSMTGGYIEKMRAVGLFAGPEEGLEADGLEMG